ncbi:Sec7-like domain containing protein [Ceratobasidium theobromae]|uniref:Sec7-like domain containing protein n=1 Tax=Ceratobasidium theobromae TaxID=1582974 RepID=A0A5N5QCI8_9AGAM|nr:Sec7-like domain containing protein [Ceratobasidium theobromae]
MASLFRTGQGRSQQAPPSSFRRAALPSPLGAVSSADRAHRRSSRTPDDFEAALRSDGTVVLKEGRDIRTLGTDTPRSRAGSINLGPRASTDTLGRRQTVSTPKHTPRPTPATPVVVPPTPGANSPAPDDDDDLAGRRRSMYRSAGTASSPDLATLMRKARDSRDQPHQVPPEQPTDRARTKSSTSSAFEIIETSPSKTPLNNKPRDRPLPSPDPNNDGSPHHRKPHRRFAKPEKLMPSTPDQAGYSDVGEARSDREGKRSMRNKTSAFFGKMLGHGQGSIRDKNRTDSRSTPTTPVATQHHSFAPPVPAIPPEYRQAAFSPPSSPPQPHTPSAQQSLLQHTESVPDEPSSPSQQNPMFSSRHKPLPPINKQFPPAPVDDRSDSDDDIPLAGPHANSRAALDARPRTSGSSSRDLDQNATVTQRRPPFPRQSKDGRRRSMSVGDIDVKKLVMEARARAEARGEPGGHMSRPDHQPHSAPLPRASVDVSHTDHASDDDEDRTEEGPSPSAPAHSPVDQRRMSKRARAVNAWDKDLELSVGGFGGELRDALGGIRSSLRQSQASNVFSATGASAAGTAYTIRPVRQDRTSSEGANSGAPVVRQIPASPLSARRPSSASATSSSSMLAVPGTYPVSPGLTNQPSIESMRTVSSETAGTYITPPSSTILDPSPTPPATSPAQNSRPLPALTSSTASSSLSSMSGSLPPRSSSLRLSPRMIPRRQPPRHRSAASASEPSLLEGFASGATGIRLVSDTARNERSRERERDQRLVSDPVVSTHAQQGTWNEDDTGPIAKVTRRGSTSGASSDIEARGQGLAARCWQEDETFLAKEKIAEWLGGTPAINKVALRYYMDYFDFTGMRLDGAFRHLCTKLYLKAETQQVDRILEEFSRRFWDCNRGSVYGSSSIVHAISYSLLLLNTDLHIAELSSHMSKTQFVRNTWAVIQDQIRAPEFPKSPASGTGSSGALASADPLKSSSTLDPGRGQTSHDHSRSQSCLAGESTPELVLDEDGSQIGDVVEPITRKQRSGSLTSWRSGSKESGALPLNASNPSVMDGSDPKTPTGSLYAVVSARGWDSEMEMLLKDMYNSVKNQQILQPLTGLTPHERQSMTLSPGMTSLGRTRSQRSHGGLGGDRITSLKRGSIRGLQSLLGAQSPYSSNSSFDGRISPSPSFATSIGEAQQTNSSLFTPTLGFASNLSHTIIKEAQEDDVRSVKSDMTNSTTLSITDEELALLGPPWAKEGMLCRKQYWESAGKRAKIKTWMDVFVVIQKGELSMFVFGESSASAGAGGHDTVGGGNWLSNANCVGKVVLAHALAHSLPPPGYNRQRPHCFVLTLASGAVYFFQAGTEDLVNEWVMTCNYWAARQSKEPLSGGVSNMEYGWNRALEMLQSGSAETLPDRRVDSFDTQSVRSGRNVNLRIPSSPFNSERIMIHEWTGPMHSVMPSTHDEETQMEALQKQANLLKQELHVHNELRQPMMSLYVPRSANALKASNNWERRSQYLLSEIVKYDSYVESLRSAMSLRLKRRGEKALERALGVSSPDDEDLEGIVYGAPAITGSGPTARPDLGSASVRARRQQVILEDEEPLTPLPDAILPLSEQR